MVMAKTGNLDRMVFLKVLLGTAAGAAVAAALLLWAVPATTDYRPAVLSTIVIPLGCFCGWLLSGSRERAPTAAVVCFGLYFLSAFAAARLGTLSASWPYFPTVAGVQTVGGIGLAVWLGLLGRGCPQVEQLLDARDVAGLARLLREGQPYERREAARALGNLEGPEASAALLAVLDEAGPQLRCAALSALVGRTRPEDAPRLEALRSDPDRRTRRLAREALRWIE
jgi:hypothetical protein